MDATLAALASALKSPVFAFMVLCVVFGRWLFSPRRRPKGSSTGGRAQTTSVSDRDLIPGMLAPGGLLYERNESRRSIMERHGLEFCYSLYKAPEGTSPISWSSQSASAKRQLADLGGPFQSFGLVTQPLQDVYEGCFDGVNVTIGCYYWRSPGAGRGTVTGSHEQITAIVALPGAVLGTFNTAATGFSGEKLHFASHPELDKTHRIRGNETARNALGEAVLDLLANEPVWRIEGKDDKLVIGRTASPRGEDLRVEEVAQFVDGVFRIAKLFGARFS